MFAYLYKEWFNVYAHIDICMQCIPGTQETKDRRLVNDNDAKEIMTINHDEWTIEFCSLGCHIYIYPFF